MTAMHIGVFAPDAPMVVALHQGVFADHGLDVFLRRVSSSREQFQDLAAGEYLAVQTAFDNVANYAVNESNPLGRKLDVCAALPFDGGSGLTLVSRAGIERLEQLRGLTISVDAPASGFAYVVYALLDGAGLTAGHDYEVVSHGGVRQRFDRLSNGDADATLLSNGLEVAALAQGFCGLGRVEDVVAPYQGSVLALRRSVAETQSALVKAFVASYLQARSFVLDPGNRPTVVEAIATVREIDSASAVDALDAELQRTGLMRVADFDPLALRGTLGLRERFGGFDTTADLGALTAPGSPLLWDDVTFARGHM